MTDKSKDVNMIDLNDEMYDAQSVSIFNDGKVGYATAQFKVERLDEKPQPTYPDYYLTVYDDKGSIKRGLYYVDLDHEKATDRVKWLGIELKSIFKAIFPGKTLPPFKDINDALDQIMKAIKKQEESLKVRVGVTYGTHRKPSSYLRLKTFSPYIESLEVPEDKSEIKFNESTDLMERLQPDTETVEGDAGEFATGEVIETKPEKESSFDEDPF